MLLVGLGRIQSLIGFGRKLKPQYFCLKNRIKPTNSQQVGLGLRQTHPTLDFHLQKTTNTWFEKYSLHFKIWKIVRYPPG
jgi:hypothetical protein